MKLAFADRMSEYAPGRMKEYAAGIQSDELRLVDQPAPPPPKESNHGAVDARNGSTTAGTPADAPRSFAPSSGSTLTVLQPAEAQDEQDDQGGDEPCEGVATADKFLTAATKEYEAGIIDQPLWKHAVAQTGGDRTLAAQAYLRARATALRVQKREKRQERSARRVRAISELGNPEAAPAASGAAAPSPVARGRSTQPKGKQVMWIGGTLASLFAVALFVTVRSESGAAPQHADGKLSSSAPAKTSAVTKASAIAKTAVGEPHEDYAARIETLKSAGNWNVVVLYAGEWIRKEPDNPAAWKELAAGYVRLGQYRDAVDAATRVTQLAPDDATAWQTLGQIHVALQQPVDAMAAFQEAVARNDQDAASLAQLGLINTQLGRFADARLAFNRAFAVNPQDVDALCGAASLAQKEGRAKDAEALTRQVASLDTRCRDANPGQSVRVAVGAGNRPPSTATR